MHCMCAVWHTLARTNESVFGRHSRHPKQTNNNNKTTKHETQLRAAIAELRDRREVLFSQKFSLRDHK